MPLAARSPFPPIADYAFLSDCHTGALVAPDGSVDWLCFPRFDSGSCFSALLGSADHGRWLLAPANGGPADERRYRDGTLILESEWQTSTGRVRVIDFMPPRESQPDIVRIVEGLEGHVDMHTELVIRFDYGSIIPWVRRLDDETPPGKSAMRESHPEYRHVWGGVVKYLRESTRYSDLFQQVFGVSRS